MVSGVVAVVVGIFGKTFYAADVEGGGVSDTPVSTWWGRVVFLLVGAILFAVGFAGAVGWAELTHE